MKKYLIPVIAAAVLLCTMLCACGQGDDTDTMPTVTSKATTTTTAVSSAEPFSSEAGDVGNNDTSDGVINENNSGTAGGSDTSGSDTTARAAD